MLLDVMEKRMSYCTRDQPRSDMMLRECNVEREKMGFMVYPNPPLEMQMTGKNEKQENTMSSSLVVVGTVGELVAIDASVSFLPRDPPARLRRWLL